MEMASNVQALSNVQPRECLLPVERDSDFIALLRTRDAIRAALPSVFPLGTFDPLLARYALSPFQIEVVRRHFRCHCGRWDFWPTYEDGEWRLQKTRFGCMCSRHERTG